MSPSRNVGREVVDQPTVGRRRRVVELVDDDVVELVGVEATQVMRAAECLDRCEDDVCIGRLLGPVYLPSSAWGRIVRKVRGRTRSGMVGLWEFPGGKCEPGESDADAARRELHEELGVEVIEVGDEELAIADPGSAFLIIFIPVRIIGEPVCREHVAFRWGSPSELAGLPLAPSDRRYIEHRRGGYPDE